MTSVVEHWVDMAADIAAINRGEAIRTGEAYLVNGRTYRVKPDGKAFPVSGAGVHQLDRGAFRALGVYNVHGLSPAAEAILDRMAVTPEARDTARVSYLADRSR